MTRPPRWIWFPAFAIGGCLASAAELSIGLLVYSGPGLLRSITTVLGVEAAALALGLWTAPARGPDLSDSIRRRWHACLASFLVATLFAAAWSIVQETAGSGLGQALGLATLAGLPLWASGALLGGLAAVEPPEPLSSGSRVAARAALGAVAGFILTGLALTRVLTPSSLLLGCIIVLSAGGLVYSHVQDRILKIDVKGRRDSAFGEVRVEERVLPAAGPGVRALVEGGAVRRWSVVDGEPVTPWEVAAFRALLPDPSTPIRVLHVGGGVSPLAGMGVRDHPLVTFEVTERSGATLELARMLMDGGGGGVIPDEGRVAVAVGNLEDRTDAGPRYDLVFVDLGSLAPNGGLAGYSRRLRSSLAGWIAEGGSVVFGPSELDESAWPVPSGWSVRAFRRVPDVPLEALFGNGAGEERVTVVRRGPRGDFETPEGFLEQEHAG